MSDVRETLGQLLQRLRQAAGLTQEQLAKKAKLPVYSLRNWEYDQRAPRSAALLQLADALGVSMEELAHAATGRPARKRERDSSELRAMKRAWDRASTEDRKKFRDHIAGSGGEQLENDLFGEKVKTKGRGRRKK